jgi:hypothetical protein
LTIRSAEKPLLCISIFGVIALCSFFNFEHCPGQCKISIFCHAYFNFYTLNFVRDIALKPLEVSTRNFAGRYISFNKRAMKGTVALSSLISELWPFVHFFTLNIDLDIALKL